MLYFPFSETTPVWIMALVSIFCFLAFGTHEETYLALYAAGVFVLLSLTSWAVVKRLGQNKAEKILAGKRVGLLFFTVTAAILTTIATGLIFWERFLDGAWTYLFMVPALYWTLGYYRRNLGAPVVVSEHLGQVMAGAHRSAGLASEAINGNLFKRILIPLSGKPSAEVGISFARNIIRASGGRLFFLVVEQKKHASGTQDYLDCIVRESEDQNIAGLLRSGDVADEIEKAAFENNVDLIVLTYKNRSSMARFKGAGATTELIYLTTPPVIVLRQTESWKSTRSSFSKILISLDGSSTAEQVLSYATSIGLAYKSEIWLVSIPEGGSVSKELTNSLQTYLDAIAERMRNEGLSIHSEVTPGELAPGMVIVDKAEKYGCDLIMMVSHGSGGVARQSFVKLGSVAYGVLESSPCPVFLVSAQPEPSQNMRL